MKVFISADIEGITGVTTWSETERGHDGYEEAVAQMNREVAAACEAAMALGYEVVVKDGHDSARNLDMLKLPRGVQTIRGWNSSTEGMMSGFDQSFDAVIYIGYHSCGGMNNSPLAHTTDHNMIDWMKVNGELASEFTLNTYCAANLGVPAVFLCGDKGICEHAKKLCPEIETVAVKDAAGNATWNIHPLDAVDLIKEGVTKALSKKQKAISLPETLDLSIRFKLHQAARMASFYPGTRVIDVNTTAFLAKTVDEMITARNFMMIG